MDKSAIILAGGFSKRLGEDKGLLLLGDRPLIKHVLDVVSQIVDESLVVVSSKVQAEQYAKVKGLNAKIFVDAMDMHSPLVGAFTGLKEAKGKYALILPCDAPFVSREIVSLLFELCIDKSAVVPRWPNGYIEPLHAVYCVKNALDAAEKALGSGELTMRAMVDRLRGVRYVSTLVLEQLDPELKTFFNLNTPLDLKKAEFLFKRKSD